MPAEEACVLSAGAERPRRADRMLTILFIFSSGSSVFSTLHCHRRVSYPFQCTWAFDKCILYCFTQVFES